MLRSAKLEYFAREKISMIFNRNLEKFIKILMLVVVTMHVWVPYPDLCRANHVPNLKYCQLNSHHDRLVHRCHSYIFHQYASDQLSVLVSFVQIAYINIINSEADYFLINGTKKLNTLYTFDTCHNSQQTYSHVIRPNDVVLHLISYVIHRYFDLLYTWYIRNRAMLLEPYDILLELLRQMKYSLVVIYPLFPMSIHLSVPYIKSTE